MRFLRYQTIHMKDEEIIKIILAEAFYIHKTIGPRMLENVYKTCLAYRLRKRGLYVEIEKPVPVLFEEVKMDCGYRADLVVEGIIIVDTKTIDAIGDLQISQLLTYLRMRSLIFFFFSSLRASFLLFLVSLSCANNDEPTAKRKAIRNSFFTGKMFYLF